MERHLADMLSRLFKAASKKVVVQVLPGTGTKIEQVTVQCGPGHGTDASTGKVQRTAVKGPVQAQMHAWAQTQAL
jgi:ribosomal protein S28E/S33